MKSVPIIAGIAALAADYDVFIVDLWGVLHDGQTPYPGTVDCMARLKAQGKKLAILSNAPRRAESVARRIGEIGFAPASYDLILSSGEDAWLSLARRGQAQADPYYAALGPRCFHLGADWNEGLLVGLPIDLVEDPEYADFVLTTGLHHRGADVAEYEAILRKMAARALPMICANPDLIVINAGKREYCAGALARRYEELGGAVRYHGKPHPEIYARIFSLLGGPDRARVLAVGDSLRTDIAGATAAGIAALLVTGGIHADEFADDPATIDAACREAGLRPVAAIAGLHW